MNDIEQSMMQYLYEDELVRLENYDLYNDYYNGNHKIEIPKKYESLISAKYKLLANYCSTIVNAPVSRLKINDLDCVDNNAKEFLQQVWKSNRMDEKTIKIHRQAIMKGDCFVHVWKDVNGYKIQFIRPEHIFAFYSTDDDDSLQYVKRQWIGFENNQLTAYKIMYYKDRIERYYSNSDILYPTMPQSMLYNLYQNDWLPYNLDGFDAVIQNPYNIIPIIHFKNKVNDSTYGNSELADAIPIQNIINKLILDLCRTADFQAYKQRYICGVDKEDIPKNKTTGKNELLSNPGDCWYFPDVNTKVGELQAEETGNILNAIDKFIEKLGEVTRTPNLKNNTDGSASSGFALAKLEAPLLDKCQELQISFGNCYEDINKLLLTMAIYNGDLQQSNMCDTGVVWQDLQQASTTDKLQEAQRKQILKQNNVISASQWARDEGYTQEEIDKMQSEIKQENETNMGNLLGHSFGNTDVVTDE